jgi:glutamine cyclotransferase
MVLLSAVVAASAVFSQSAEGTEESPEATPAVSEVEIFLPEVINIIPHGTNDFTQGLVWNEGRLFQSTGRYGESRLQELNPETGDVVREVSLEEQYFGEGLALVGDQLVQITWREATALIYDLETFDQTGTFEYDSEGWGLCSDGESIYMSDGSSTLYQRDPETFEVIAEIPVTLQGQAVPQLNELECVEDSVYANVWYTDAIVRIDKETGEITGVVDMRGLLTPAERRQLEDGAVLNGIAYNADDDTFYVTGKLWPSLYEVHFEPVAG